MRRLIPFALLLSAAALPAQSFRDMSVRAAPQFHSYTMKAPLHEKVSQMAMPFFFVVPVMPTLTVDVGTAYAIVNYEQTTFSGGTPTTVKSDLSGLTDTQIRANYAIGQDFVVVTAGVNLPTGSATVDAAELPAAMSIGSDFLTFPVSSFGTGLAFTGGIAVARPVGSWNFGLGASVRQSTEYEPFRDDTGATVKFTPGSEYRVRTGIDRPFGSGRMAFGLTYSKFGEDQVRTFTANTGDRYIAQFSMNNSIGGGGLDYSFVLWNLYRASGTLLDLSEAPSGNITNGMLTFGIRANDIGFEPSIETRVWTEEGSKSSFLGTLGMRAYVDRGRWSVVPGFGFSVGSMQAATMNGFKATLGIRVGG